MTDALLVAIDQGTTLARSIVYDAGPLLRATALGAAWPVGAAP